MIVKNLRKKNAKNHISSQKGEKGKVKFIFFPKILFESFFHRHTRVTRKIMYFLVDADSQAAEHHRLILDAPRAKNIKLHFTRKITDKTEQKAKKKKERKNIQKNHSLPFFLFFSENCRGK